MICVKASPPSLLCLCRAPLTRSHEPWSPATTQGFDKSELEIELRVDAVLQGSWSVIVHGAGTPYIGQCRRNLASVSNAAVSLFSHPEAL